MTTRFRSQHRQRAVILGLFAIGVASLVASCDGERATDPQVSRTSLTPLFPRRPSGSVDYSAAGSANLGLGSSNYSPILSVPLPQFTYQTLVRVSASGTVSTELTPYNDGGVGSPPSPGAPRTFGPGGYYWGSPSLNGCGTAVFVSYSQGDSWSPGCASDQSTDTIATVQSHIYVGGLGSASRTAPAPATSGQFDCFQAAFGPGPCFSYSTGGQHVTLDRVVVHWQITAQPRTVVAGDTVTFIVSWGPDSVAGKKVPFDLVDVKWVRLRDGQFETVTPPCTWNQYSQTSSTTMQCRGPVFSAGWMQFTARANGIEETKQAYVSAVQCFINFGDPEDSLLNDARIRKQLGIALARAKVDTLPPNLRREVFGVRYLAADSSYLDTTFNVLPGATPCLSYAGWTPPAGLGIGLITWHIHPFDPEQSHGDTLPDNCPRSSKLPSTGPRYSFAGPSGLTIPGDLQSAFPFIVVDKKNMYWRKDGSSKKWKTKLRQQCDVTQYGF